jgi:hypothetical protein
VTASGVSPLFKVALSTLSALTLLVLAAAVAYTIFIPNPTESQAAAEAKLFQITSYGFTALAGLFTGKVA